MYTTKSLDTVFHIYLIVSTWLIIWMWIFFRYCDSDESVDKTEIRKKMGKIQLDKSSTLEQDCPEGQTRGLINAEKTCKHNFELIKEGNEIKLKKSYGGEILNANNFCLTKYSGSGMFDRTARICMDDHETALSKVDIKFK